MAPLDHELLVDLFRDGALATELLRTAGIAVDHAQVRPASIDLAQVTSTGYRADSVAILHDRTGKAVAGIIVEIQRNTDRGKRLTWPLYIASLRAQFDCPVVLLVIAPTPSVARWARGRIDLGHPGFQLIPIVIGLPDVPQVRDRGAASRIPQLAVLSALAHRELEIATIALRAISRLPRDQAKLYFDAILAGLSEPDRQTLEATMTFDEYAKRVGLKSYFVRRSYGEGRAKGQTEGRKQGRVEGRKEGRVEGRKEGRKEGEQRGLQNGQRKGLQKAAVALARTKLSTAPASDLARIASIRDERVLTRLITSLGRADTAAAARAALARATRN